MLWGFPGIPENERMLMVWISAESAKLHFIEHSRFPTWTLDSVISHVFNRKLLILSSVLQLFSEFWMNRTDCRSSQVLIMPIVTSKTVESLILHELLFTINSYSSTAPSCGWILMHVLVLPSVNFCPSLPETTPAHGKHSLPLLKYPSPQITKKPRNQGVISTF